MVALVKSCTLVGIDAVAIDVECIATSGQIPHYNVVGLPAPAVKEGSTRIRGALKTVGHDLPLKKVTVNLAPADLRKPSSALDLPIAVAIMIAEAIYDGAPCAGLIMLGELGLDGTVRSVRGVLAAALLARDLGMRGVLVPEANAAEALVVEGIEVYAASHLKDVVDALAGRVPLRVPLQVSSRRRLRVPAADMSEVRGQDHARAAIEIAVAGGHNLLLSGPPGTGKTHDTRPAPEASTDPLEHIVTLEVQEPRAETQAGWAGRVNASPRPPCACGCGGTVPVKGRHRSAGAPKYLHGHHPNPIRRVFARLRAEGYVLLGEACRQLGISETSFRRLEAAKQIPAARRVEAWSKRSVRVLSEREIEALAPKIAAWRSRRPSATDRGGICTG
ncbi:MAG: Mg chelatase, subunit ChlI [Myxococcales bacterium]|nr:Mg chelatase, subunit ChlI [Myxococcales bacterium]